MFKRVQFEELFSRILEPRDKIQVPIEEFLRWNTWPCVAPSLADAGGTPGRCDGGAAGHQGEVEGV